MCARLRQAGPAHRFVNRTGRDVVYLDGRGRVPGDTAEYPYGDVKLSKR